MDTQIETPVPLVTVGNRTFITTLTTSQVEPWRRPVTSTASWILTSIFGLLALVLSAYTIRQIVTGETAGSWPSAGAMALIYGFAALIRIVVARRAECGPGRGDTFSATHSRRVLAEVTGSQDTRFAAARQAAKVVHGSKTLLAASGAWGSLTPETGNEELLALARCAGDLATVHAEKAADSAALQRQAQADWAFEAALLAAQQVAYTLSVKAENAQPQGAR